MKPKIGILTNFTGADETFSLVSVARIQAEIFHRANYRVIIFVSENFTSVHKTGIWSGKQVEIRKVGNHGEPAENILEKLRRDIADIDVVLCHDLVFLAQNHKWGSAIRQLAKETDVAWIHWQHSRGDGNVEPCENSWYAYPNEGDLAHLAKLNGTTIERTQYIPHPLDFNYLDWPDLAIEIAEETRHPFVDVAAILPTRMDRQKQVERVIRLMAGFQRAGKSVSLIVADAFATGERFIQYRKDLQALAREQDVDDRVHFLSERYEECMVSTPRPVVKALMEMSNLFIQPSNAETSSLVAMEAALAGNLLVINADFPPIHHLYKKALALPFGSVLEDTKYYRHIRLADGTEQKVEDPQTFWDDQALRTVLPVLESQVSMVVKRQQLLDRWPSRVFKNHLEPLVNKVYKTMGRDKRDDITGDYKYFDPEVTAIITTLDNARILERQIPILLSECGLVIVVNNGSRDETREVLEANAHPRLEVIHRENNGAGPGRNAGLDLWAERTPYTLMVDGGILPPINGVHLLKTYLVHHPEAYIISPEVATCFTTDWNEATQVVNDSIPDLTFWQRCLSSTAYCLCRASAWDGLRFSEDGPYGEPGWGVDDNDMAYRWNEAEIVHHEFTHETSGWKLYRRASGSFKRLFEETGVWPNGYGSVYEARNVKCFQDWWRYHRMLYGFLQTPTKSHVFYDPKMPEFAKEVKRIHEEDRNAEIVVKDVTDPEALLWLDTFALRWEWGDTAITPDGKIIRRGADYPEELWSGNVVRDREPVGEEVIEYDLATPA